MSAKQNRRQFLRMLAGLPLLPSALASMPESPGVEEEPLLEAEIWTPEIEAMTDEEFRELERRLRREFTQEFCRRMDEAILYGDDGPPPAGLLKSPSDP